MTREENAMFLMMKASVAQLVLRRAMKKRGRGMTREEAYKILSNGLANAPSEHEWCIAFEMAIEALEQEPKWIPVSERSPEDYETVIASTDKEIVYPEARYTKEYGWAYAFDAGWERIPFEVIAWMPLPEPYKVESEDKE